MRYPKRSQYKYAKSRSAIRNWAEYEAGLRNRGDLTVWLSDAALDAWRAPASGKPCGQGSYSDLAIESALTIRMVFRLPIRRTEGFLRSLVELFGLGLPIPDHTMISRRLQGLGTLRSWELTGEDPIHLLIGSTGLGSMSASFESHQREGLRKLHLAVNADAGEILASDLTNRRTADCVGVPTLLDQIDDEVASVTAE